MPQRKKLLVLGGTAASLDVVRTAKSLGVHTIVTDNLQNGVSKKIADENALVSTCDYDGLLKLIKNKKVDGIFCGPSEFNIVNTMKICKLAGLPFYANEEQWELCSNKVKFKKLCRDYGVPVVPDYEISKEFTKNDLDNIEYPVIVKPVDGHSSKGVSVCYTEEELKSAYNFALEYSSSKNIIVEKYIQNYGLGLSAWYIVNNSKIFLSLVGDRYIVDPSDGATLICALSLFVQ